MTPKRPPSARRRPSVRSLLSSGPEWAVGAVALLEVASLARIMSRQFFRLMVGGMCLVLARWWAPYGWWAWGPRLVLPWLPAVLLVVLYAHAGTAEALVRATVATPVRAALLAGVLVGGMVPSTDWARRAWWYPVLLGLGCAGLWHFSRQEEPNQWPPAPPLPPDDGCATTGAFAVVFSPWGLATRGGAGS